MPADDVVITIKTKPVDYKVSCRLNGGSFTGSDYCPA
jgi:hypothetical protein